ncbi:hypothetical protein ACHAXT_002555 [Thalassiosira profunda]
MEEGAQHPPHVHRLLRLVREGTPSHASRASALLGRYAASCCAGVATTGGTCTDDGNRSCPPVHPGPVIWDLIGRLVGGDGVGTTSNESGGGKRRKKGKKKEGRPTSGLFDANWATRANCALALESVARCLPLEDRRNFFEGDGDGDKDMPDGKGMEQSEEEVLMWLTVNDLGKSAGSRESHGMPTDDSTSQQNENAQNQLEVVVERGRLLLASSGDQYDWDCDDEAKEYIREHEALRNLDATAIDPSPQPDDAKESLQQSFLTRRVKLQRQILARRLGLGGVLSAPIVAGNASSTDGKGRRVVDDIVADDDLAPKIVPKGKGKGAKQSKAKKRKRPPKSEPEPTEAKDPGISIRALLVLESQRSADDEIHRNQTRHANPQTLLGSELAYRTFDPDWTVRHGALLGTLALLRAWKVHEAPCVATNNGKEDQQQRPKNHRNFGRWPQDILARCVCILALDQFADFSGASCEGDDVSDDIDIIASGAIVAPVREMAAQITALLLEAAPADAGGCAHQLLMQLYTRQQTIPTQKGSNGWEMRHGVLLAWKYVCAMALFHSQRRGQLKAQSLNGVVDNLRPLSTAKSDLERYHSTLNNLILQSIRGLSDASDDNRAVAAQVLRHSLLIDAKCHTTDIAKESSEPLWSAMTNIREGVSSCAADLLHLLAELLSRDCATFLACLQETSGSFSLDAILQRLAGFIVDDSTHVRTSCFCALRLVAEPIGKALLDNASSDQATANCVATLCQLLIRLFETFFSPEYICGAFDQTAENDAGDDSATELSRHRNKAWSAVLNTVALLRKPDSNRELIDNTGSTLILRYLGVTRALAGQSCTLTRIVGTVGERGMATEISYRSRVASANALAQFYSTIYSQNRAEVLTEKLHAILQSPWLSHSEAGYLLHTSLASSDPAGGAHPFFEKYLQFLVSTFEGPPTCVLLEDHKAARAALDDPQVQSICDNELANLLDASETCNAEEVVGAWEAAFTQRGVSFDDLREASQSLLTKASMRLSATISGALIACGPQHLPPKVTPLIRSLMTSLRNEESHSRRSETCRYLSQLISLLPEHPAHEKARTKLIETVCSIACDGAANPSASAKGAEQVIELLVASMSSGGKLEDLRPLWDRLSPLLDGASSGKSDQQQADAIFMLRVISGAMSQDCPSFRLVLDSFLRSAVDAACRNEFELARSQASMSINNFCKHDFSATMDRVVPSLLPILTNLQDDRGREGGCELLLSVLHDFEVLAAPFVTTLLPVAMRLMTDVLEECSRSAASAFAILVRIAPLTAGHLDKEVATASNKVIRHLILGKPLPPCALPEKISSELEKSGTTLRPYQVEGISWLSFLSDVHLNGALCDDMGLGKTLQALVGVAMSHCRTSNPLGPINNKQSLVVCPSSVVGHWVSEIKRFFPSGEVFACFDFTGNAKSRRGAWRKAVAKCNIFVTSYSVLRTDISLLESVLWDWCILDEGHLLKNPETATAKASRRLKARHKLILTGTPIQNNVHEIWATFDFLLPNFLGTEKSFLSEFAKPIVKSQASDASAADINRGMECLKILHQQVLPFVLRREKGQVVKELPPKIITDVPCALSKQQRDLYQQTLTQSGMKEALAMVDQTLAGTEDQSVDAASPPRLGSNVLTSLLQLRLMCTHPLLHSLFASKKNDEAKSASTTSMGNPRSYARLDCSGKLSALNDLLRHAGIAEPEIAAADNDESGFLIDVNDSTADSSDIDCDCLEGGNFDTLDDSPNDESAEASTNASKCLIFAQFTQSLDIVERLLFEPHMPSLQYLRLDGSVPGSQRNSIAERFNEDPTIRVLLLTTKVGGLGLNLTGADKVIFLEPDWNPYVDLQAMDRAHRIGQTRTVNVYRLITTATIEEKMMKLQRRKKATSEAVVNADNSTLFSMGTDRLLDIFTFRGDSANAGAKGDAAGDDVLGYLDGGKPDEYSSLSVDSFMRGLM